MTVPLIDVTGHRQRRQREMRRRRLRRLGVVAALLALVGGLVWVVYGSPLLVVRDVAVVGNQLAAPELVVAVAEVPPDVPLALVDISAVADRVVQLQVVERAVVDRSWPSTITIRVTERQVRLAVVRTSGYDWVDVHGVVFHQTPGQPEGTMLAEVEGADHELLARIVTVADALPGKVRERARVITAETGDSIVVELSDGSRVVWGSAEESDLKAQVVAALMDVKAGVYDVSSPTHPTTRGR